MNKLTKTQIGRLTKDIKSFFEELPCDTLSITIYKTDLGFYIETWAWEEHEVYWAIELNKIKEEINKQGEKEYDWVPLTKEHIIRTDTQEGAQKLIDRCIEMAERALTWSENA